MERYIAWIIVVALVLLFLAQDLRTCAIALVGVLMGYALRFCRDDAPPPPVAAAPPPPPPYSAVAQPFEASDKWAAYPGAVADPVLDDQPDYDYTHGFQDRTADQAFADAAGSGGDGAEYVAPEPGYPRAMARLAVPPGGGWPTPSCGVNASCSSKEGMRDGAPLVDRSIAAAAGRATQRNTPPCAGGPSLDANDAAGAVYLPQNVAMGAANEASGEAIDYDEENTYQVRARAYGVRAAEGMAQRKQFLDPYLREELDEEENTNWMVGYQE